MSYEKIFQIIVPVYNEEKIIETVLRNAKKFGYLEYLVIANDASTDATKEILDRWNSEENLQVVHLTQNAKKEGATRFALEFLSSNNKLKPYTILLDADTRLQLSDGGLSVEKQLLQAIEYLNTKELSAMALRVNATYFKRPSPAYLSAYSTYFGLQFDCWLIGLLGQLWVINGAGGLFRSNELLEILRNMNSTFETGDLQITVELMKQNKKLQLYDSIKALTYVPEGFTELFNQRRRWERGTMKVLFKESSFYIKQFTKPTFLSLATILHFVLYIGIFFTSISFLYEKNFGYAVLQGILNSSLVWLAVDLIKGASVAIRVEPKRFPLFCFAAIINIPVWIIIVLPARLYGGFEALLHLITEKKKST